MNTSHPENIQMVFVVIMKGNEVPDYPTIEKSMKEIINKLIIQITREGRNMLKLF